MAIKVLQARFTALDDDLGALDALQAMDPQLVLVFGAPAYFMDDAFSQRLTDAFPGAQTAGCSTCGEITAAGVTDNSCVVTAVRFQHTQVRSAVTTLKDMDDSHEAGARLARQLNEEHLKAVIVFGQGVAINGSALLQGMGRVLPPAVPITGGLAGDGDSFVRTWTLGYEGASERKLVAVGLYGDALQIGHGCFGGWQAFGPARKVTRCDGNVLFELDGEPALDIYKRYLGEYAKDLPASGLLFPFSMLGSDRTDVGLIRTILGIDEAESSLILAGDIDPEGYLRLMHSNTDSLVDGSQTAAEATLGMMGHCEDGLAILVSCVGRKLIMGGRVDEEVEAAAGVFGRGTAVTGFYSHGEFSPYLPLVGCKLHNQTMAITYLSELNG